MNLISSLSRRYQLAKGRRKLRDLDREYSALKQHTADFEKQGAATKKELLDKKLQLIGSIVFVWSTIEMRLGLIVQMINICGESPDRSLPRELDRKLDYLKTHGLEWNILHDSRPLMQSVLSKAHAEKVFRHNLIHGEYSLNDNNEQHTFLISLSKVKGARVEKVQTTYSGPQLVKRSKAIVALSTEVDTLLAAVTETLVQFVDSAS